MANSNRFMGYCLNTLPLGQLVTLCAQKIKTPSQKNVVFSCANPHSLAIAESHSDFRNALENADILVTDGVGLSIVGNILDSDVGPRITGSDFFTLLMEQQNTSSVQNSSEADRKTRIYFFGSSKKVLELIKNNLEARYSNLDICGYTSPPYGDWSDAQNSDFIAQINAAKPDILWVGMTAPKQELWTYRNRNKLAVPIIGNIGAVFDFCAGTYERAPEWARKAGVEWLVRLWREPKRMWRRNIISPVIFVVAALRHKITNRKSIVS
jgi:N-acetylglucosaminyldiphosphoundecaprenol N-acetyl-beta-D-mannosaminyltransferase